MWKEKSFRDNFYTMKEDTYTTAMCSSCQKLTDQELLTIFFDLRKQYQNWKLECSICKTINKLRLDNDEEPIEIYDDSKKSIQLPCQIDNPPHSPH